MKVETKKVVPAFEPVVLTLESQGEVDLFKSFLGAIRGHDLARFDVDTRTNSIIYDALNGSPARPEFNTLSLRN
jgi:hypothetical protein